MDTTKRKSTSTQAGEIGRVSKLMHEMGAKWFDATPTEHTDFFLEEIPGESPLQQLLAVIKVHTVRRLSAYAVNKKGEPLTLMDIAANRKWTLEWTQKVWRRAEEFGLVRRDSDDKLFLCGKVKKYSDLYDSKGDLKYCTILSSPFVLPGYLKRQITKFAEKEKAAILAELGRVHEWGQVLERDAMAGVRGIIEQKKDSVLQRYGLAKQEAPKRREPPKTLRIVLEEAGQLELFPGERIVQTGLYNGNSASVQSSETTVPTSAEVPEVPTPRQNPRVAAEVLLKALEPIKRNAETPPAGGPLSGVVKGVSGGTARPPGWHSELRTFLLSLPVGVPLDDTVFLDIVSHLREELLDQFKEEAKTAAAKTGDKKIRNWRGYEAIAKQVAQRGPVARPPTKSAKLSWEERHRMIEEAEAKEKANAQGK